MGIFDEIEQLADKAEKLAKEHPDQLKSALTKAEELVDEKTDHKFSGQLQQGVAAAEKFLEK